MCQVRSPPHQDLSPVHQDLTHTLHFYISVEEFDEEEGDVIHHQHKLLTCLDLATEGQYSILHEDKSIYSDSEEDFMPRA